MARLRLGLVLKDRQKLDDAIQAFRDALELDRTFAEAHAMLGATLGEQGKWADAIAAFKEAVKHRPNDVQANQALAQLLTSCPDPKLHDPELAAATARHLIALGAEAAKLLGSDEPSRK